MYIFPELSIPSNSCYLVKVTAQDSSWRYLSTKSLPTFILLGHGVTKHCVCYEDLMPLHLLIHKIYDDCREGARPVS